MVSSNTSIRIRTNRQSIRNLITIRWGLINIFRTRTLNLRSSRSSKEEPEIHQFPPISGSELSD